MRTNLTAFKWDGERKTVLKYMTREQIREHIRGIRLLDSALLIKNGREHKVVHVGNVVFQLPNDDWIEVTPKEFKDAVKQN